MADSRVIETMSEQSRMEAGRANFDNQWQEVADRVDPAAGQFTTKVAPGVQRVEKQFDSTATIALGRATAAFESMCTPRTQKWQGLVPSDASLRKEQEVKAYLERFRDLLFQVRYSPRANFANQNSQSIHSFLNYGNNVLYTDEDPGRSLRYRDIAMNECYFGEDHNGRLDRFHRKFMLSAQQLQAKFPRVEFSDRIKAAASRGDEASFDIVHRVCTNHDRDPKRRDYAGMPLAGFYVLPSEQMVLDVAGFRTMPYNAGRYRVVGREVYGRGPVMDILATIKTVNEMKKTNLRQGQRIAEPPLLASRDGMVSPFILRAGHINYGGLNDRGEAMVKPLDTNGQLPVSLEMQQAECEVINDALFVTLFQILDENPTKTATQVLEEVQQRGVLMSPPVGNLQSGFYGPMTEREIDLLSNIGGGAWLEAQIGPMPEALRKAGGAYEIEYDAPINKAQRAEEGIAIQRGLEQAIALAAFDPSVPKAIKVRPSFRRMLEITGFPADLINSEEDLEEADAAEDQQAQMTQLLGAAPIIAESAKNMAQAQAVAGASPQPLPAGLAA